MVNTSLHFTSYLFLVLKNSAARVILVPRREYIFREEHPQKQEDTIRKLVVLVESVPCCKQSREFKQVSPRASRIHRIAGCDLVRWLFLRCFKLDSLFRIVQPSFIAFLKLRLARTTSNQY
mmetsp:Transcript_961/g.2058  ORF Transcript_961/g.2058 Transcript_961/m.2058 type:complete len:121 (+) Transcript_961:862-1224(+)